MFGPRSARLAKTTASRRAIGIVDGVNRYIGELHFPNRGLTISGVRISPFQFQLSPGSIIRNEKWQHKPVTDEWFSQLRFVAFEWRERARFTRTVTTERLTIPEPPQESAPPAALVAEAEAHEDKTS